MSANGSGTPASGDSPPARTAFGGLKIPARRPIGEMLVEAGLIEPHALAEALRVQTERGGKLVEVLISLGHFNPSGFVRFLAKQPGIASIDLSNYEVPKELVALVPREFALKHEVFPIDRLGKLLTLGMVCPLDSSTIGELETSTGLRVKPLLCSAEDIRHAINRYYPGERLEPAQTAAPQEDQLAGVETSLRLVGIVNLVRNIEALPTLPETVLRVREAMTNPECSMEDVANIVTGDPPIAAKVLSVANSAAYGFVKRINTVRLAVSLLGLRELYSIVLTSAIINRSEASGSRFDYRRFWSHSMACAGACKVVAQLSGHDRLTSVPTAALLHDLGVMALVEVAPELHAGIDDGLWGDELLAAEERCMGISHAEAGYELASHWGLPNDIAEAIRFHHRPEYATEAQNLVAIIAVGDALYRVAESAEEVNPETFEPYATRLSMVGFTPQDGERLLRAFLEQRVSDAHNGRVW